MKGIAVAPILFVVAILAVLVGALSSGSGGFGSDTSAERDRLAASAIINHANQVQAGIDRVFGHACSLREVSFASYLTDAASTFAGRYVNPNSPSNKACHVFDAAGGNIQVQLPLAEWLEGGYPNAYFGYVYTGSLLVPNVGSSYSLAIMLPNLKLGICKEINRLAGFTTIDPSAIAQIFVSVPNDAFGFGFAGIFGGYPATLNTSFFDKKPMGCSKAATGYGAPFAFYKVLAVQ